MTRRRFKAHIVEREILAAIQFYQARGWSWATVVGFLGSQALWRRV